MAWLRRNRHLALVVLLLATQVVMPLIPDLRGGGRVAFDMLFSAGVLATLWVVFEGTRARAVALATHLPALLLMLVAYFVPTSTDVRCSIASAWPRCRASATTTSRRWRRCRTRSRGSR
jgi:hypothetical protein